MIAYLVLSQSVSCCTQFAAQFTFVGRMVDMPSLDMLHDVPLVLPLVATVQAQPNITVT